MNPRPVASSFSQSGEPGSNVEPGYEDRPLASGWQTNEGCSRERTSLGGKKKGYGNLKFIPNGFEIQICVSLSSW